MNIHHFLFIKLKEYFMSKPEMLALKTATCKSISGKSTLTYQIGCAPDSTVHVRISKNSDCER